MNQMLRELVTSAKLRGFGSWGWVEHLCFSCSIRYLASKVSKMKWIAFIKDPDGYWIEIFDVKTIGKVISSCS
ncbi:dehydration-responsive element-binding protein 3-like [Hibiscus syriacus]|uniref:Dehydration-responsive element-binding protein 3-like n=1 Tax=Hibiscus syriacus TaxID=106335 RepID=A0A6A3CS02_HIBSY|nr:dehydration-responsive element-binding protein 3-like [Hibiscus syriacus]